VRELVEANNHTIEVTSFRKRLLAWGQKHFRPFPWRCTADPYRVLIAEVMLHRTQASQVVPVYEQFIARYSDVATLAKAKREELRKSLRPLGLHWRIDLMHEMASDLMVRFHGQVPQEKGELLSLPGVSEYIASAVLCFAWNSPQPLIDTNTVRVTGRCSGWQQRIPLVATASFATSSRRLSRQRNRSFIIMHFWILQLSSVSNDNLRTVKDVRYRDSARRAAAAWESRIEMRNYMLFTRGAISKHAFRIP